MEHKLLLLLVVAVVLVLVVQEDMVVVLDKVENVVVEEMGVVVDKVWVLEVCLIKAVLLEELERVLMFLHLQMVVGCPVAPGVDGGEPVKEKVHANI